MVAVSPDGDLLGCYRKIHVYDAFGVRESDTIRPGDIAAPLLFTVGDVTVGALTCYDLRFPEVFRWITDAGAELVALPAAWATGPGKDHHWQTLIHAQALENTIYVAAADQTGPMSCAMSMIVDPMSVRIADAGEQPGLVTATVTRERIAQVRAVNPSLRKPPIRRDAAGPLVAAPSRPNRGHRGTTSHNSHTADLLLSSPTEG